MTFLNPAESNKSQVPDVQSMDICLVLCEDEDTCVSITHQPSTSNCWLKNKEFGDSPGELSGVNSRNLNCPG